jgi:hypothetical protein
MSNPGIAIECLVAVLLLVTIGYCAQLNGKLTRLKSDEKAMKSTIAELLSAAGAAERAIAGLKLTVRESNEGLGAQLMQAERYTADMRLQTQAGEEILRRLGRIATAGGVAAPAPRSPVLQPSASNAKAVAAAAEALAARAKSRVDGLAA